LRVGNPEEAGAPGIRQIRLYYLLINHPKFKDLIFSLIPGSAPALLMDLDTPNKPEKATIGDPHFNLDLVGGYLCGG
jgi:hypothetical protein